MQSSTVTSKGQITIPKALRDKFGLGKGAEVVFYEEEGVLRLKRRTTVDEAFGMLHKYAGKKPLSDAEMRQAIERAVTEKFRGRR